MAFRIEKNNCKPREGIGNGFKTYNRFGKHSTFLLKKREVHHLAAS
jgi:hypothetical protein